MNDNLGSNILNKILFKDGKTLILRKAMPEDAYGIVEYLNITGGESDNLLFGKDEFHFDAKQEAEHLKIFNKNINSLIILGVVDNEIVSIAQIANSNRKRIEHNAEVAISVKKDYWHVGIGSAVMKQIIKFGKQNATIKTISLGVKGSNNNAIKMYEKFGFKRVGFHKDFFNIDGKFDDEILMDLYI